MAPVYARAVLFATVLLAAAFGPSLADAQSEKKPLRILFIGNSYTRFHDLPRMVDRIAQSATDGPLLWVRKVTHNGATLRHQWNRGHARSAIERGNWAVVVLQAHSLDPFDRPDQARDYAGRFVKLIRKHGAKPVLFMPWPRKAGDVLYRRAGGERFENPKDMLAKTKDYYANLGSELKVDVVPVGQAWFAALQNSPKPNLYMADRTHPTQVGTFLTACLFYRALTGHELDSTEYRPWPMRKGLAQRLKGIATQSPTSLANKLAPR